MVAVTDSKRTGTPSLYHIACEVLVPNTVKSRRCSSCSKYRISLRAMLSRSRRDESDRTDPRSHINYCVLTSKEKDERMQRLHQEVRNTHHKLERMKEKIANDAATANTTVDNDLDADLRSTILDSDRDVMQMYPEGSFQSIFWEQQKKAASLKDSRSMKWHPLFIKWCLYLRHISGKGYELLRNTNCIHLPSQRTLRDYTYYTPTVIGFSAEVDKQLLDAIDMSEEKNR